MPIHIDERRRMFRLNRWQQPQAFVANRFAPQGGQAEQDVKQVWFAGVHADIGGGYPEEESALAKLPLFWMIQEAASHGLRVQTRMVNHLVLGAALKGAKVNYTPPSAAGIMHDSLTWGWMPLEALPKAAARREWPGRDTTFGFYLPWAEPRLIGPGQLIHRSVLDRVAQRADYRPPNLPADPVVEPP